MCRRAAQSFAARPNTSNRPRLTASCCQSYSGCHWTPRAKPGAPRARTASIVPSGAALAELAGGEELGVNSLHNQGIARLAPRLVAEAKAPDGTIEAVRVRGAPGFALGVQWHPEYDWQQDAVSRGLFELFGRAARDWAAQRHMAQAAE